MLQKYTRSKRAAVRPFMVLAAAAASAGPALVQAQTSGTWAADVGTIGGNWSDPANWVGGAIANNGGTATFPTLSTFTSAPLNIQQDLPTVNLAGITFDAQITYVINPAVAGNTLTLTGPATIHTPDAATNTLGVTFFGHQLRIPVAGSAGLNKTGPGTLTLWESNTYTGGTSVSGGGILVARQFGDAAFGDTSGSVSLNDGTIRITTGAWNTARTINLLGNGTIEATTSGTTTFNAPVIGAGDLNKIGSRGLNLTADNTYTGATNLLAGTIGLSGAGAIRSTSALTARGEVILDNSAVNDTNRINNAAPLTLLGSGLTLTGNGSAASSETVGATTFSRGTSTVTVAPGAGQGASVAFGTTGREHGGVAFFRGTNLGAAPGADTANVTLANPPTLVGGGGAAGSTDISIIPWAYGNTNAAAGLNAASNSFVTYGPNGVRPLDINSEYVTAISPGVSTNNVRITTSQALAAPATINALVVGSSSNSITGGAGATLTITSGGLLNLVNGTTVDVPLDFGSAEGMIISTGSIGLNGGISGSGGITKQGAGVATFAAANTYTGTTTIGGGTAAFTTSVPASGPGPFGSSSSAVVLAPAGLGTGGTTARIAYTGGASASFSRDLLVTGRIAHNNAATIPGFGTGANGTLVMDGDITLDGSPLSFIGGASSTLILNGDISGDGGPVTDNASAATSVIQLNGNNTFTEGAELTTTTWEVGSNTAFGTGTLKMVQTSGQPTLRAVGGPRVVPNDAVAFSFSTNYWQIAGDQPITFTGSLNLSGSYTHNINNTALTTYAGVLHTGGFTKAGTGTLVVSGDNVYTGSTTITSGALRVAHPNALGSTAAPTIVAAGAAIEVAGNTLSQEPLTITGIGIAATGAVRSTSGNNSFGPVTLAGTSIIAVDAGHLAVGDVSASVSTAGLFKDGPGNLSARRYRLTAVDVRGGTAAVTPGRSTDKTSVVNNLILASGTRFDLGDNDLVIDYDTTSPLPLVRSHIANAHNGGNWNDPGITSSEADATSFALGYGESSAVFTSFPAAFSGVEVDDTSVLVRYTRYGDANLDGLVNLTDFNALANNFGTPSGALWTEGDFDYNGVVNLGDFNLLANNFGLAAAGPEVTPQDWSNLAAAVPEPGTLGLIALAAPTLLRRRRGA